MKISVALATYNGARFLDEQLNSIAGQTLLPSELVVTDDVSDDGTCDIIRAFAAKAPFPVRLEINAERLGYRANFLKAASLCCSDLIAFSDQDDIWLPQKLARCRSAFQEQGVMLAYHNATVTTEGLEPIGTLDHHAAPRVLNPLQSIDPWRYGLGFTLVFRRQLLVFAEHWRHSVDFFHAHEREAHDQFFFFLASCLGDIRYLDEHLVLYRQHGKNACGWAETKVGLMEQWNELARTDMTGLKGREVAAGRRAGILERITKDLAGDFYRRAQAAAQGYRKLEHGYRMRLALYASASIPFKLSTVAQLLRRGGYQPRAQWGVGRKAFIRDIVRGVLVPINRLSNASSVYETSGKENPLPVSGEKPATDNLSQSDLDLGAQSAARQETKAEQGRDKER